MKRLALLLPLLALAAGCHKLTDRRAPEDDPADIARIRPHLAHTNADVRNAAIRVLEDWFADLAVPFPADDPALPADLEAAAEARAAEPAQPLSADDGGDASTLRLDAAAMCAQGPLPMPPFAVLTNGIGRLDCWARLFLVDADDSSLRCVQELLGVRYDERNVPRAAPTAIRSRWLLAPAVSPDGTAWHAALGPRLDRLLPMTWQGAGGFPAPATLAGGAATLTGGAAAPVRLLPAYGGALDWDALALLQDTLATPHRRILNDNPVSTNGFSFLGPAIVSPGREHLFGPASVDFALRPDPATPGGVILTATQAFEPKPQNVSPAFATNRTLRSEVPLLPGQTALFGARTFMVKVNHEDRVPVLSDIPLLGRLFTRHYVSTNAAEIVLLVRYTPRHAEDEPHAEGAEGAESKSHAESAENAEPEPHAEGAESKSHAESAENAEPEPHAEGAESKSHAESAENAEPEPHAENAESAEPALPDIDASVSSEELWRRATSRDPDASIDASFAFHELRTRAFRGDDEAMSLYFWKTDDWWRGSSFFPVTIRSVEPEKGAGASTNWIVTLGGGIRLRVDAPAETFGAPPGSLPGRRLGVRFRDYKDGWRLDGAPSAMSNACVYVGAIEVRPLLPASEVEAAREIIDRNLDDLTRLTDAGREELERRIGECWVDWGSGMSYPTWFFEEGVSFTLTDGYPTDHDFGMDVCKDETPAVTVDGEVVATWSEVAREAIRLHRPTERMAREYAENFLLRREGRKYGFATAWHFVHDEIPREPKDEAELRTLWEELRAKNPEWWDDRPFEESRGRVLDAWLDARAADRRARLLAPLLEKATIEYTPMPDLRRADPAP